MEVSSEVLKGLQLAGSAAVNDATFSKLAQRSLQDALGSENNEKLPGKPQLLIVPRRPRIIAPLRRPYAG